MNGATVNLSGEIVIEATNRGIWGFIEASIQALLSGEFVNHLTRGGCLTLGSTAWFSGGATINDGILVLEIQASLFKATLWFLKTLRSIFITQVSTLGVRMQRKQA